MTAIKSTITAILCHKDRLEGLAVHLAVNACLAKMVFSLPILGTTKPYICLLRDDTDFFEILHQNTELSKNHPKILELYKYG